MNLKGKKIFLFLAAMAIVFSSVACGNGGKLGDTSKNSVKGAQQEESKISDKKTEPVKLTIWHEADNTIAETIQKKVNENLKDKNITVLLERKEQMSDSLKLSGDDPKTAPDMYFGAHDKLGIFAQIGIISPITDLISEDELKDLIPMTVKAGTYLGKKYQMPLYFETLLFLYNKDLINTVPGTTDELLASMKSETKKDSYVFVEQHSTAYNSAPWMHGYGAEIISEDAKPGLSSSEMVNALEYYKQFVEFQPADGEYNTVTTLFSSGKAKMTIGGPWLIPGLKEAGVNYGIASMPKLLKGKPLAPYSGVQGIQVLKHAAKDKANACTEVLKASANPKLGIELAKVANCAPANQAAYKEKIVSDNEMIMAMREIAETAIPMPNIPEMDVMWSITDNLLADVNKNGKDVKTSCDIAQKEAEKQIKVVQQ